MTSSDTYQLKWHSHSTHLNGSVANLLRSERFTDVVLCTMDGSQIPAHKFILSSCSMYLSTLFEGQRSVTRMGGMLYVVLPSEITTHALKILVQYMYKGETTVSNEILDTVLKAGEVLKIRGLWRQADAEASGDNVLAERTSTPASINANKPVQPAPNKQVQLAPNKPVQLAPKKLVPLAPKKPEDLQPKIVIKNDDNVVKTYGVQGATRPMFIGPPKLVFIKANESGPQSNLRPIAPKGQSILIAPASTANAHVINSNSIATSAKSTVVTSSAKQVIATSVKSTIALATTTIDDSPDEGPPPPRLVMRQAAAERKYGKKPKITNIIEIDDKNDEPQEVPVSSKMLIASSVEITEDVDIKEEPYWDVSSIEDEERSIAEMFQNEINVKTEPGDDDDVDVGEESLLYSPLSCELCAAVFTAPAAWVRHVRAHARAGAPHARKRKQRSQSDDTEETMALLRCDLCQKHFPNPAEWVRHIQSAHTEAKLAKSNNRAPPRHNRFTQGEQNKTCSTCKKTFPSHASMLTHMRTHTDEQPFVCGLCNKGFNVKSNLVRHLRTVHDQVIGTGGEDVSPGPSEVKREA